MDASPPPQSPRPGPPWSPNLQTQSPSTSENLKNVTQNPPYDNPRHHRVNRAPANFRAFVMKIADSDPNRPLTAAQKSLIENRLTNFFPDSRTPNHPTYAAMIYRAILELSDEWGSSEESISKFIKNEYHDLPWAHSTFLKHHLWKLSNTGEIVVTREKCYLLGDAFTKPSPYQSTGGSPEERFTMKRRKLGRPCKKDVIKDENEQKEEEMEIADMGTQGQQIEHIEEKNQSSEQRSRVITEQEQWQKQETKVAKKNSQLAEQQNRVIEGLSCSQSHKQQQQEQGNAHNPPLMWRLRHPKPESAAVAFMTGSLPLGHWHVKQQEPDCNGLGRPVEALLDRAATFKELSPADQRCPNEQHQPVRRRPGRPPKLKRGAAATAGLLHLISQQNCQPESQEQPKDRVQSRPPKCEPSIGRDVEIDKSSSNPGVQVREDHEKVDSGFKDGIKVIGNL